MPPRLRRSRFKQPKALNRNFFALISVKRIIEKAKGKGKKRVNGKWSMVNREKLFNHSPFTIHHLPLNYESFNSTGYSRSGAGFARGWCVGSAARCFVVACARHAARPDFFDCARR